MTNVTSSPVRPSDLVHAPRPDNLRGPIGAHLTVRRDATRRSDGRVTDVFVSVGKSTSHTEIFIANPTEGVIEPAALAEFARRTVRNAAPIYDDPRDVLMRLDDVLAAGFPGVFMTALFALVQQGEGFVSVSIANRGHVLPILVTARGAHVVGLHGLVLGPRSLHRPQGELTRVMLNAADQLLLINDRPSDGPMPQPMRPHVIQHLPLRASDHDLAEHVIELYGGCNIDVIVVSGSSGDD